MKFLFWR